MASTLLSNSLSPPLLSSEDRVHVDEMTGTVWRSRWEFVGVARAKEERFSLCRLQVQATEEKLPAPNAHYTSGLMLCTAYVPRASSLFMCTGHVGSGADTSLRWRTTGNLPSQHRLLLQQNHPWTAGTGAGIHSKFKICRYLNLFPSILLSLLFLFKARILSLGHIPFENFLCSLGCLEFTLLLPQPLKCWNYRIMPPP